jgi:DinB superfamily
MHPRTQELLEHLDRTREELRAAVDQVPPALRDQRPQPGHWSVGEVLEHLVLLERRVTKLLTNRIAEAQTQGLAMESETSSVLEAAETLAVMARLMDRSQTIAAPQLVQPQMTLDAKAAWAALEETRAAFRDAVRAGDGLALGTLTYQHPVFGPLTLYQWIAVVGTHEARHGAQIRDIAEMFAGRDQA